jgi:hypothetical protein
VVAEPASETTVVSVSDLAKSTSKALAGHRPKIPNTNSAGTNGTSASRRDRILDIKGIALSAPPKIRSKLEADQAKPWKPEGACGAA